MQEIQVETPHVDFITPEAWSAWRAAWTDLDDDLKRNYYDQEKAINQRREYTATLKDVEASQEQLAVMDADTSQDQLVPLAMNVAPTISGHIVVHEASAGPSRPTSMVPVHHMSSSLEAFTLRNCTIEHRLACMLDGKQASSSSSDCVATEGFDPRLYDAIVFKGSHRKKKRETLGMLAPYAKHFEEFPMRQVQGVEACAAQFDDNSTAFAPKITEPKKIVSPEPPRGMTRDTSTTTQFQCRQNIMDVLRIISHERPKKVAKNIAMGDCFLQIEARSEEDVAPYICYAHMVDAADANGGNEAVQFLLMYKELLCFRGYSAKEVIQLMYEPLIEPYGEYRGPFTGPNGPAVGLTGEALASDLALRGTVFVFYHLLVEPFWRDHGRLDTFKVRSSDKKWHATAKRAAEASIDSPIPLMPRLGDGGIDLLGLAETSGNGEPGRKGAGKGAGAKQARPAVVAPAQPAQPPMLSEEDNFISLLEQIMEEHGEGDVEVSRELREEVKIDVFDDDTHVSGVILVPQYRGLNPWSVVKTYQNQIDIGMIPSYTQ